MFPTPMPPILPVLTPFARRTWIISSVRPGQRPARRTTMSLAPPGQGAEPCGGHKAWVWHQPPVGPRSLLTAWRDTTEIPSHAVGDGGAPFIP